MEMKDIEGTAYTLIAYSTELRCKVRLVIWQMPNGKKKLFLSLIHISVLYGILCHKTIQCKNVLLSHIHMIEETILQLVDGTERTVLQMCIRDRARPVQR